MPLLTAAEAVGLFLFAVGIYGGTYRGVTRHLSIHGVVPLDWFYLAIMVLGAGAMLFGRRQVPAETRTGAMFQGIRLGVSLGAVGLIAWWMVHR